MVLIYPCMVIFEFMFWGAGLQYLDVSISFIRQIDQKHTNPHNKHVRIIRCDQNVTKFVGVYKKKVSNLLKINKLETCSRGANGYLTL